MREPTDEHLASAGPLLENYNTVHPRGAIGRRSVPKAAAKKTTEDAVDVVRRPHPAQCPRMRADQGLQPRTAQWRSASLDAGPTAKQP
jgi:hypothetical protein